MAEAVKLDEKDRKILIELDNDAAQGFGGMARKLRTSKEAVAYRVKQLEEKGIISSYVAVLHFAKLGLTYYRLYFKFSHISPEKRKEAVDFLLSQKNVAWLGSTEGSFDLIVVIGFDSVFGFEKFKNDLFLRFDRFFQRNSFAIYIEGEAYPRQYIAGKKNPMRKVFVFCSPAEKEPVDEEDYKILRAIAKNSRASSVEIAKITGLTDRIVRYRKAALEKKGVIVGYKLAINYRKLNYLFFKCLIKLQGLDEKKLHRMKLYARQHPNIIHWIKVIGEWDLELEVEAPSVEEFYRIASEIREQFSDVIQTFDAVLVSQEHAMLQK